MSPLDLPDQREHRRRILTGRVDADGQVRRPDGPRPDACRRPTGQIAVRLGHEGRAALVACCDDADPDVSESVEQP